MRALPFLAVTGLLLIALGVAGCGAATAVPGASLMAAVVGFLALGAIGRGSRRDD